MSNYQPSRFIDQISRILERKNPIIDVDAAFQALVQQRPGSEQQLTAITDNRAVFIEKAKQLGASVTEVMEVTQLQHAIEQSIAKNDTVSAPAQAEVTELYTALCTKTPTLAVTPTSTSVINIVQAHGGIAETGTLCFVSSSVPSSTLFLCEKLFVVVNSRDLCGRQEQLWQTLKTQGRTRCRAVHLVTGPSRTADVEQTVQVGAHDPKELHIFLLG